MRARIATLVLVGLAAATPSASASSRHAAATLCVGPKAGCFPTLQAAAAAAASGDTILIAPGTYAGGITITKSLNLVGAGAGQTVIRGGGPVLTIGTFFGTNTFTVSIRGVAVTGGVNDTQPGPDVSFGGGIWIPVSDNQTTGATVTIADGAITGNQVTTTVEIPPGGFCGPLPCGFADGGGIDNAGVLTLTNTTVSGNQAGPGVASGAFDGGIVNRSSGTLIMSHSWVTGNRAVAGPPNGRGASVGGIGNDGQMTIDGSVISNNSAQLTETFPGDFDEAASAGGVAISDFADGTATIRNTIISGNRATSTSTVDVTGAFAGGILDEGTLTLNGGSVAGNQVATTAPDTAFTDGGGLEIDGTATIAGTLITGNSTTAGAGTGQAFAQGGGLANVGHTTLQHALVLGNRASASGPGGAAQGGGIWNSVFNDGDPAPVLTLLDSVVSGNVVTAKGGITPQGGGLFTTAPVTVTHTLITGNAPDQCQGC